MAVEHTLGLLNQTVPLFVGGLSFEAAAGDWAPKKLAFGHHEALPPQDSVDQRDDLVPLQLPFVEV